MLLDQALDFFFVYAKLSGDLFGGQPFVDDLLPKDQPGVCHRSGGPPAHSHGGQDQQVRSGTVNLMLRTMALTTGSICR